MRRMALAVVGLAAFGMLMGCAANTQLTNVWTDPAFQTNSLKKLMVIGVAQNSGVRRTFEDQFAAALQQQGVGAVASYAAVGDGPLDSASVVSALLQHGCDGVFLTRLIDKQTVDTYYPPTTTYVSAPSSYYGGWYGYYSMGYAYTSSPGDRKSTRLNSSH